jgi:hypothetical protein
MTRLRARKREDGGYVALLTALMMVILIGMAAFSVDVGNWYVTGRQAQNAADAAALAGVPSLPGEPDQAFATAQTYSAANDFKNGTDTVVVDPEVDSSPTRLRVTVSKTVDNIFGGLFGIPKTTITRTAVADFAGPVPLGSPCNEYGNDPGENADSVVTAPPPISTTSPPPPTSTTSPAAPSSTTGPTPTPTPTPTSAPAPTSSHKSANCEDAGEFWANVGSPQAPKGNGDAYQNGRCDGSDGCDGSTNVDYDPNGYFYTVDVKRAVNNLVIEAFDPALIDVGDYCEKNLAGASALSPGQTAVADPATRYVGGSSSKYCTGDIAFTHAGAGFDNQVRTSFTVRDPSENPWDPLSYPVRTTDCPGTRTYPGYSGNLSQALQTGTSAYDAPSPDGDGPGYVASVFRQWVPLCTIPYAQPGKYLIQIKTNGVGADDASGHNRFALRAYSSSEGSAEDDISVSGYNKMAMYANFPGATATFFLARVPSGSKGQTLNIKLFDIGDGAQNGTIEVLPPAGSGVGNFTDCVASGQVSGQLGDCRLTGVGPPFNKKWQQISVPIPDSYTCDDEDMTKCWVKLKFTYGSGSAPNDTTSWGASIEGDPVRLVE